MAFADTTSNTFRSRSVVALALVFPLVTGCAAGGGSRPPAMHGERGGPAAPEISDEGFAVAVHDLLLAERGTNDRAIRLGAVEARQMARADARFKSRATDRGLSAVSGGLYLVHVGEQTPRLLGPHGPDALKGALRELSTRGDEGRARSLYDLLLPLVAGPERADVLSHLSALDAWIRDAVAVGGPVASAGALERIAVRRRLLEPSDAALTDATKATSEWIARAVVLRDKFRKTRTQPPREEGAEAWRALETGPLVLASLYLRDANASAAVAALDRAQARELLESERPQFAAALGALAKEPTSDRCIDLLTQLRPLTGREQAREEEDFADDRDLFGAAAFAVAGECYRLDPTVPQVSLTLGIALEELGMAEAAPGVLSEAVQAHPDAHVASEALALALDAIASEEDAGEPDAARRAFAAAQPLLAVASLKDLVGKVHPSAARLRAAMGEIELREGRIGVAGALL